MIGILGLPAGIYWPGCVSCGTGEPSKVKKFLPAFHDVPSQRDFFRRYFLPFFTAVLLTPRIDRGGHILGNHVVGMAYARKISDNIRIFIYNGGSSIIFHNIHLHKLLDAPKTDVAEPIRVMTKEEYSILNAYFRIDHGLNNIDMLRIVNYEYEVQKVPFENEQDKMFKGETFWLFHSDHHDAGVVDFTPENHRTAEIGFRVAQALKKTEEKSEVEMIRHFNTKDVDAICKGRKKRNGLVIKCPTYTEDTVEEDVFNYEHIEAKIKQKYGTSSKLHEHLSMLEKFTGAIQLAFIGRDLIGDMIQRDIKSHIEDLVKKLSIWEFDYVEAVCWSLVIQRWHLAVVCQTWDSIYTWAIS
uniref:Uncharacterized protein n=1 Tax=Romanomermis culicivorax TaxID=13658 RepID=A0A915IJA0_ROMCU